MNILSLAISLADFLIPIVYAILTVVVIIEIVKWCSRRKE